MFKQAHLAFSPGGRKSGSTTDRVIYPNLRNNGAHNNEAQLVLTLIFLLNNLKVLFSFNLNWFIAIHSEVQLLFISLFNITFENR